MEIFEINSSTEVDYGNDLWNPVPLEEAVGEISSAKAGNRAAMRMMKHAVAGQVNLQPLEIRMKSGHLMCPKDDNCIKDSKSDPLIHQAILENSPIVVQFLINHGVDINAVDANGNTPIIFAIEKGYTNIVDMLIQAKANLETRRKSDAMTPLELAISKNNSYISTQLLNAGANPNNGRPNFPTLLAQALNKSMIDVSQLLIQKEAKVDVGDSQASNPLYQAYLLAEPHRTKIIDKLLEKGADLNRKLENQMTVFCAIIDKSPGVSPQQDLALIQKFCDKGADVHAKNAAGKSALELANDKPKIMVILNEYRKDIGYLNEQFTLAVQQKSQALVQKWLDKGADIDCTDKEGKTALSRVFSAGDMTFAQFLVDKGSKIDRAKLTPLPELIEKQVFTGQTLLNVADFCLRNKIVSADSVDASGRPLLSVAVMVGNLELVQLLVKHKAKIEPEKKINGMTPLQLALKLRNQPIAQFLIENGADVNAGRDDSRVIMLALKHSMHQLIPLLLDRKVQLNIGNDWNTNPLAYVIHYGNSELVKKFIENGADINYKISTRIPNSLFVAVQNGNPNSAIIEYLLQNKVKIDQKDAEGHSSMWWAIQSGRQDIVALLLKHGANQEDIG